jgi:hypothetical protein
MDGAQDLSIGSVSPIALRLLTLRLANVNLAEYKPLIVRYGQEGGGAAMIQTHALANALIARCRAIPDTSASRSTIGTIRNELVTLCGDIEDHVPTSVRKRIPPPQYKFSV